MKEKFVNHLPEIKNDNARKLLSKAFQETEVNYTMKNRSYFSPKTGEVYISKSATDSTLAHELFHKIDHNNAISINGFLNDSLDIDCKNLMKISQSSGQSTDDMIYLKYPEAFIRPGKVKEEYRGLSDMISGMTNGNINLGYGHRKEYWAMPLSFQIETFAQYGRFYYAENPEVIKTVNDLFPETSNKMNEIISLISRFEG